MSFARVLAVWAGLAVLMSANGVFREEALKPALGERPADVVSALAGIALILLVTAFAFRSLAGQPVRRLAAVSALLVALTLAFEFAIGLTLDQKSWSELAANYAFWRGALWPFVLLVVALTPFIWGRWMVRPRAAVR